MNFLYIWKVHSLSEHGSTCLLVPQSPKERIKKLFFHWNSQNSQLPLLSHLGGISKPTPCHYLDGQIEYGDLAKFWLNAVFIWGCYIKHILLHQVDWRRWWTLSTHLSYGCWLFDNLSICTVMGMHGSTREPCVCASVGHTFKDNTTEWQQKGTHRIDQTIQLARRMADKNKLRCAPLKMYFYKSYSQSRCTQWTLPTFIMVCAKHYLYNAPIFSYEATTKVNARSCWYLCPFPFKSGSFTQIICRLVLPCWCGCSNWFQFHR